VSARMAIYWAVVCIPLAWGVWQTLGAVMILLG
jgi:hypothetical protein